MRNLLSFVLGVISRLFYLLLRLILLLDRTICRVYDLPVWSRFAGVLRQAGRRRSVCALSVFGLLFLLPALLLTRPGTLLLADGQPLGVIEDSATLLNAVNAVESSASAVSGTDYYLPLRLQARPVRTAAPLLTQEELEHNLITASGELDTLAVISVDGRQTAIAAHHLGTEFYSLVEQLHHLIFRRNNLAVIPVITDHCQVWRVCFYETALSQTRKGYRRKIKTEMTSAPNW